MTNKRKTILQGRDNYYVNIDKIIYKNLTRRQVAFVCLVNKLNKANLVATNKEIGSYLDLKGTYVHRMIKNINDKFPGLVITKYNTKVNRNGKILTKEFEGALTVRSIHLSRELHVKGNAYINLSDYIVTKRSNFLSGNELDILAYLKSMPNKSFKGYLRIISAKLSLSLGIIKRALSKLLKIKLITKSMNRVKHKLKNIFYTVNTIYVNTKWSYQEVENDGPGWLRGPTDSTSNNSELCSTRNTNESYVVDQKELFGFEEN